MSVQQQQQSPSNTMDITITSRILHIDIKISLRWKVIPFLFNPFISECMSTGIQATQHTHTLFEGKDHPAPVYKIVNIRETKAKMSIK